MKPVSLLLVILSNSLLLSAQQYYPFPSSNAIWHYKVVGSDYAKEYTVIDSLGKTITIESVEYIELYKAFKNGSNIIGAIREDTTLKKVYFNNFFEEIVLYDFKLIEKDSILFRKIIKL